MKKLAINKHSIKLKNEAFQNAKRTLFKASDRAKTHNLTKLFLLKQ